MPVYSYLLAMHDVLATWSATAVAVPSSLHCSKKGETRVRELGEVVSRASKEYGNIEGMGILGRAIARIRGRGGAAQNEPPTANDSTPQAASGPAARVDRIEPVHGHLGVVVGADGVFAGGHFIDYSDIVGVRHESQEYQGWNWGYQGPESITAWSVALRLSNDQVTKLAERDGGAAETHTLAQAIESAHKAWLALAKQPVPVVDALVRGEQDALGWLRALRRLGSKKAGPYREFADLEPIYSIIDDARARLWARTAAAIVLMSAGDPSAAQKLRAVSASLANPVFSSALQSVATASDDNAVAAALDALHPTNINLDGADGPS